MKDGRMKVKVYSSCTIDTYIRNGLLILNRFYFVSEWHTSFLTLFFIAFIKYTILHEALLHIAIITLHLIMNYFSKCQNQS